MGIPKSDDLKSRDSLGEVAGDRDSLIFPPMERARKRRYWYRDFVLCARMEFGR